MLLVVRSGCWTGYVVVVNLLRYRYVGDCPGYVGVRCCYANTLRTDLVRITTAITTSYVITVPHVGWLRLRLIAPLPGVRY